MCISNLQLRNKQYQSRVGKELSIKSWNRNIISEINTSFYTLSNRSGTPQESEDSCEEIAKAVEQRYDGGQ